MKALVLEDYNQLVYTEVPHPVIDRDEVLIQVKSCGICGSDVHGVDGSTGRRVPPIIMGHEASGVIAEVGSDVSDWQVGDRVTFDIVIYCGQCYYCRRAWTNLCDNRSIVGVSTPEFRVNGAFAEYVAIPQKILRRLPDRLSFEQAAMMEAASVAAHAVEITPISLHDTAVVIGAGTIGLMAIQLARIAGCGRIIAVDLQRDRLDLALKYGADVGLLSGQDDVPGEVRRQTRGLGADVAFEAVGASATVQMAVDSLRKRGTLTLIGNLAPFVELPLQTVQTREIVLKGSANSIHEPDACLEMMASGAVDVTSLISAVAPLSEGASWFKRLQQGETGLFKVILVPGK